MGLDLAAKMPAAVSPPIQSANFSLFLHPTDESQIIKIIKNLKESTGGKNGVRAEEIKAIAPSSVKPLIYAINASFKQGIFPQAVKDTVCAQNIRAKLKKSSVTIVQSPYQPLSPKFFKDVCILDFMT